MEDLNKEIETWEEIKPENVGVYLSDKRDSINIDGYSDAIRSRYAYETNVQQMPKSDYVGMVRFNNEKTKRNPLTSAFRGAWSGLLQLPAGVDNAVTGLSEWITNAIYSGDIEAQKEISEAANTLRQKNDAWLKEWSYQKDEKDSSFAFDFGQGGGSMFAAIGLSILTRNPNMAATMFGASQYGNLNKELREKGFDINYGNLTALVGGIAEGGLEKFGLHMWFENYASKKIGTFLIKQGATEFVQESSQQAAEEFIMRVSGGRVDGKSFSDVVSEVLYAGALGGMLGFVGGGVSIPSTQAYKGRAQKVLEAGGMSKDEASRYVEAHLYGSEKEQKELEDKVNDTIKDINVKYATLEFKKLGIEEEQAKEFAENMATNPEEVKASLIDLLNKEADFETLQNNSLADDVAYFKEQRKKDIVAEAFDIKEKIKEDAIAAGVSEEDAEVAATLESNFALRMFEETGETPLDYYENKRAKIEVENPFELTEDLVEGELIDESELTEEEIARLEAAEQARAEEDIPFFQESLDVAKENARLDDIYPAYEGETIDINGVQKTVYNSNGERIAKSAEALRNFYKWFGDSKVVDGQGRPLVVYHATNAEFDTFDTSRGEYKGYIWTTSERDSFRAKYSLYNMPLYIKIENPKVIKGFSYAYTRQDTRERLINEGYDGVDNGLGDYIAFNPNQIKSTSNRGTYSESENIYYQSGVDDKDLYATHNMSLAGVREALKLGGLAMPSLAMRKVGQGNINQFGDIVFVANERLSTPSRTNEVYDRDAWTPNLGYAIKYDLKPEAQTFIKDVLERVGQRQQLTMYVYNITENLTSPQSNDMAIELYHLDKMSKSDEPVHFDRNSTEYLDWYDEHFTANTEPYLWTENASNTDMVRKKFTLDNMMRILRKQERSGGGYIGDFIFDVYKLLNFRSQKFKNLKEIKKNRHKLVSREEAQKGLDKLNEDFLALAEDLKKEGEDYGFGDATYGLGLALIQDNDEKIVYWLNDRNLQSDEKAVKKVKDFIERMRDIPTDYFEVKPRRAVDFSEFSGVIIPEGAQYDEVARILEKQHYLNVERVEKGNEEQYENALQNIQANSSTTFFQGENNPRGAYMPASRVIHLFKNANRSTLIHEFGHHFTMQYVKALEQNGRKDKLEGFYNWLGINDISEATTQTWEQMARGFETYVMEGIAPNIDTESLFEKFKRYLIDVYTDLTGKVIKPEEINDDVREFFDEMIAGTEELPDVRGLEGKLEQIKDVVSGALKGEEVNFEGLSIKDLRELTKLLTMRRPRKPKNLKQRIRAAGGIDIDFAKAIGIYDSKKGNEGGFFKKNGEIAKEDSLIEFLADAGYLSRTEGEDYEQNAQIYDDAIELIENADNVYTAEEQQKIDERVAIENMAYDAAQKLGDIKTDDIFKAMKVLKKYDMKAVDKNTLKYLNASIKQVERLAKEAKKELKQDISDKQAQLIDFVKKLPLSYKSQMKIMERLKRAKLADDFEKVINQAAELSKEFYLNEKRKMLSGMIDEQVKSSKPKKVTQQKYDYANNKLFKDLRDYSKMTQEQAAEQLGKAQINDDITPEDLVRMHYLNYKANGAKTSTEMLEQVYADLVIAKQQGLAAKDEADFEKSMNREAVRQEIIDAIDANDADKNTLKTRIGNLYRKGLTNLYSLINSISSKKLADAFEMETVLNRAQVKYHKQTEALKEKAFRVYNVKSAGDLLNRFADMGKTIGHLYNVDGVKAEEISVMKLVDIYNAMKNEKTRQDYIDNYGEEQLERLLSYLTPQDIAFADLMMEDINSLFPEVNKTYIKIYGMDLLKVENYWPATSEHTTETSLLGDYYSQQTTPSSWKERVKGKVTPIPQNAWTKYLKHINENIYMINTAEKYKELATVFKSKRIRNKITNKFGAGVYNELMKQISALSLNAKSDSLNYIESAFGSILNNFVVAKIAVAPTVFAGQLTSITNYAENVKSTTFYKYFAEGLTHPKQTIKFMKDVAGDFLEARYKGGYAESISNVLSEAEDAMSQKFRLISPKTKYNTANALSSFVRMGDIGAIIFGGYGQVKANLEAGMSMDEAVKRFEFDTLRSQQSSIKASLGSFQQSKGIARMFLAFKNTQHQYFRKIADAVINLQRGEISSKEAAKIIGNYALIQTTLYVMAKNLVNAGLGLLDDDDKITDGVLEQILLGTIDAIPFLSDMLHFAYRRLSGQYSPNLLSMVGIDDIQRSINKFYKQEKNVYDYVEIITPLIEGTTSLPVQRFERMFKKYTEE